MSELSCATTRELAPELALGVLTGYERATAHAHLGMCPPCREYVTSLTRIGDLLLTLAPGVEPPVGFEDRVLATMGFPARRTPRRRWRTVVAAAAATAAGVVFGIGGWAVGNVISQNPAPAIAEMRFAQFHGSDHSQVGQVFTYGGSPSWVYMSVTNASASTVTCQLEERDGTIVSIGSFPLSDGKGFWGRKVNVDPNTVVGARLVADHGRILATATFDS